MFQYLIIIKLFSYFFYFCIDNFRLLSRLNICLGFLPFEPLIKYFTDQISARLWLEMHSSLALAEL